MRLSPGRFEVRHLEALVAVAEEGTFRGAADILGYSQAAVSQQIAGLEAAAGAAVFDRPGGPRPVTLTPTGRILLGHAHAVLERLDRAREDVDQLLTGTSGRLVVGAFQSVSVALLPHIVGRVLSQTPNLQVRAVEADENEYLVGLMQAGEVDVAFLAETVDDPYQDVDFDTHLIGQDPFVAVVPRVSAAGDVLRLEDIDRLIGGHPSSSQAYIERQLRAHGVNARYVFRSNDNGAMQAMVRAGMGVAIMPRLAVNSADEDVRMLPTEPAIEPRSILLAVPRGPLLSPAAQRFADISTTVGAEQMREASSGSS